MAEHEVRVREAGGLALIHLTISNLLHVMHAIAEAEGVVRWPNPVVCRDVRVYETDIERRKGMDIEELLEGGYGRG